MEEKSLLKAYEEYSMKSDYQVPRIPMDLVINTSQISKNSDLFSHEDIKWMIENIRNNSDLLYREYKVKVKQSDISLDVVQEKKDTTKDWERYL